MDLNQPLAAIKRNVCGFRGCTNELPESAAFEYCETCRILYVTDRITLLTDPFSSRAQVLKDRFVNEVITHQTAAEVLATRDNLQFLYLEYCKVIKLYGIEPSNKKAKQTIQEQIEEARSTGRNVETRTNANKAVQREKLSKLQKQMKAIGCKDPSGTKRAGTKDKDGHIRVEDTCPNCNHEKEAKRIFNDELGDIAI